MSEMIIKASIAIRNIMSQSHPSDFEICGNCIVEFCTALDFDDDEICEAISIASGNSLEEDEFLDGMISRIRN